MPIKRPPEIEREARRAYAQMSKSDLVEAYRDLFLQVFPDAGKETQYANANPIAWMSDLKQRIEYIKLARRRDDAERQRERNAERAAEAVFERE